MAIIVTQQAQPSPNPAVFSFASIALDNSYPTGGYSLTPANFSGFASTIDFLFVNPSGGYVYEWVPSTQKLKMYRQTAATGALVEVPNATDVSAISALKVVAIGH